MEKLYKKALWYEYFTVGYNLLEAAASIIAGGIASSIALIGFGLDSLVESLSGGILIWRLRMHGRIPEEQEERIEERASRFVGITFFILAVYILVQSIRKIVLQEIPDPSLPGIIIAVLSLIIMPILGTKKFNLGKELGLRSLVADAKETFACTALSVALLLGLGLHYLFGFWLADPIAGICIAGYLLKEGWELVRGEDEED